MAFQGLTAMLFISNECYAAAEEAVASPKSRLHPQSIKSQRQPAREPRPARMATSSIRSKWPRKDVFLASEQIMEMGKWNLVNQDEIHLWVSVSLVLDWRMEIKLINWCPLGAEGCAIGRCALVNGKLKPDAMSYVSHWLCVVLVVDFVSKYTKPVWI